jgi:type II secretory pathway pseudopilin PulG
VVIVLAVVGLIFAIVFAAIPQLKRSTRDNQRRSLALRLKTEIETYAANNEGQYPFGGVGNSQVNCNDATGPGASANSCNDWYSHYVNGKIDISDPTTGLDINVFYNNKANNNDFTPTNNPWNAGNIYIVVGGECNGGSIASGPAGASSNSRDYAMMTALEISGSWTCVDNT